MQDETILIQHACKGDLKAFHRLVEHHSHAVYSLAYRILNNKECAEDCAQEVFLKIHQKITSFEQNSSFSTWLYSITTNTAIDIQRKRSRHQHEPHELEDLAAPYIDNPESQQWREQVSNISTRAINQLPEDVRVAFMLRHYQGCSIEEISRIQNQNPNTVKHRIFRGVKRLREVLAQKVDLS